MATLVCAGGSGAAPQFVIVFRVAQPHANGGHALTLARSLGFASPSIQAEASAYVVTEGSRELVLYKASGTFDYVDRATYGKVPAAALPSPAQARTAAIDFLRRRRLLPGQDARIAVRPDLPANARSLATYLDEIESVPDALTAWERAVRPTTDATQRWAGYYDRFTKHWPNALSPVRARVIWAFGASPVLAARLRRADRTPPVTKVPAARGTTQ